MTGWDWEAFEWPDLSWFRRGIQDDVGGLKHRMASYPRCFPLRMAPDLVLGGSVGEEPDPVIIDGGSFDAPSGTECPIDAGDFVSGIGCGNFGTEQAPPYMIALGIWKAVTPMVADQVDIQMVTDYTGGTDIPTLHNVLTPEIAPGAVGDVGTAWRLPDETVVFFPLRTRAFMVRAPGGGMTANDTGYTCTYYAADGTGSGTVTVKRPPGVAVAPWQYGFVGVDRAGELIFVPAVGHGPRLLKSTGAMRLDDTTYSVTARYIDSDGTDGGNLPVKIPPGTKVGLDEMGCVGVDTSGEAIFISSNARPRMIVAKENMTTDDTYYVANYINSAGTEGGGISVRRPNGTYVWNGDIGFLGIEDTALLTFIPTHSNKVRVSQNDTTPAHLLAKLAAGSGITISEVNDAGDEDAQIALTATAVPGSATNSMLSMVTTTSNLTDTWAITEGTLAIRQITRMSFSGTDLYMHNRVFTYDAYGRLASVSAESRAGPF